MGVVVYFHGALMHTTYVLAAVTVYPYGDRVLRSALYSEVLLASEALSQLEARQTGWRSAKQSGQTVS